MTKENLARRVLLRLSYSLACFEPTKKMKAIASTQMKKSLLASSIAIGLGISAGVQAGPLMFSSTGGGAAAAKQIGAIDVPATSFVAVGGQAAIAAGVGSTFQVLLSAAVNRITDQNGTLIPAPFLNSSFELTVVAGITEKITAITATGISFTVQGPAFFRMYYDTTPDKDYLNGSGFNDGRLIASSNNVQTGPGSSFNLTGTSPTLDNFSGDSYPGQSTKTGFGTALSVTFSDFTVDTAFFTNVVGGARLNLKIGGLSAALPFGSVDPSGCFTQTPDASIPVGGTTPAVYTYACAPSVHVNGPYSSQAAALPNGIVPDTGSVNGLFSGSSARDFVAQTDPILTADVPEPAPLALAALGAGALALFRRRRRQDTI